MDSLTRFFSRVKPHEAHEFLDDLFPFYLENNWMDQKKLDKFHRVYDSFLELITEGSKNG